MPYIYLNHVADIGIMATGASIEEAFESGAEAMLNVMFDTGTIDCKKEVDIDAEAGDIAMLFVEVLNELLSRQGVEDLAFGGMKALKIRKSGALYRFHGRAYGEALDPEKHSIRTEVKAATYAGLEYKVEEGLHILQCILDV